MLKRQGSLVILGPAIWVRGASREHEANLKVRKGTVDLLVPMRRVGRDDYCVASCDHPANAPFDNTSGAPSKDRDLSSSNKDCLSLQYEM